MSKISSTKITKLEKLNSFSNLLNLVEKILLNSKIEQECFGEMNKWVNSEINYLIWSIVLEEAGTATISSVLGKTFFSASFFFFFFLLYDQIIKFSVLDLFSLLCCTCCYSIWWLESIINCLRKHSYVFTHHLKGKKRSLSIYFSISRYFTITKV